MRTYHRFVQIHRDPDAVFQSTLHTHAKILPMSRLQRYDRVDWVERVIRQYKEVYDVFFKERGLIPAGRFHEVRFERLEADPAGEMRKLYHALGLPDFRQTEAELHSYVASLSGYRKNVFPDLPPDQRRRIACEWHRCFEEWGYPT